MRQRTPEEYSYMLRVLDKAEHGMIIEQKEFDRVNIHSKIKQLIDKYDIHFGKEKFVPDDEQLADRLFLAGMELAIESGIYCIDTQRQMRWEADELEWTIQTAPSTETLGSGKDSVTILKRCPGDIIRVSVAGGPSGIPVPEDLFEPIMLSYAQEPLIEIIDNASLLQTYGRPIRAGSPWEVAACWQEVKLILKVLERANRPGLALGCAENAPSAIGELATTTYGGFRLTDWHQNALISELKTSYSELIRAIQYAQIGCRSHGFYNPIYGGYVGGHEGVSIAIVGGLILMRACYGVTTMNAGPSHPHLSCDTHPDLLSAQALAFQALSRNTNLLIANFIRPVAGPCTKDILYEVAALTIASVTSGISLVEGVQSARGINPAHCSGLEARFAAQVAHSSQGITPQEANPIVSSLVAKYAPRQKEMQKGKSFLEAYNLDFIQPTDEWRGMYEEVVKELHTEFGLSLED
jgi:methylamine--corrinoid protein Co-methyltransferase